jgi:F0F1-type ATP synthase assembly protein I
MTGKSTAYRIVAAQVGATVLVASGTFAIWQAALGLAALVGGLAGAGSSLVFALIAFRGDVQGARPVLGRFYLAEGAKFLVTILTFLLAIVWWRLPVLPLLAGYASTLLIYWLALLPSVPTVRVDRA